MDLRDLYQDVILDHSRNPRCQGALPGATLRANGHNPLCGDKLVLNLRVKDGIIEAARFEGSGCAISMASSSMMTEYITGKTVKEAEAMYGKFHHLLTGDDGVDDNTLAEFGKLAALAGVRDFPVRVKCATLSWHTLEAALKDGEADVSTE